MTTEKIVEKLAKIKAHADSAKAIGNEQEAQTFAAMLQQMLLKHKLEMTDIEYLKEMQSEPIVEHWPETEYGDGHFRYKAFPDIDIGPRTEWIEELAMIIAHYNSCRILVVPHSSHICFVGHKSNVEICEYLFLTMLRTATKISDLAAKKFRREYRARYGKGNTPGGFRSSFLTGFIRKIRERLDEERERFRKSGGENALVRVGNEMVQISNYLENKFKDRKPGKPLGPARSRDDRFNEEGYRAGQETAKGLDIRGNAMKEGKPNQQLKD